MTATPYSADADILPVIPAPEDLASDRMVHHFSDLLFNPPGCHNEWGHVQATRSVSGLQAITFPPYISSCVYGNQWNKAFTATLEMTLDGRLLQAYPRPSGDIAYTWYPHTLLRETHVDSVFIRTETFIPPRCRAVAAHITLTNTGAARRTGQVGFILRAGVAKIDLPTWPTRPPSERDNEVLYHPSHGCLVFRAQHSPAVSIQGFAPHPVEVHQRLHALLPYDLAPGQTLVVHYVHVLASNEADGLALYNEIQASFESLRAKTRETHAQRLINAFTPGNKEFSGSLPRLVTRDPTLWKLYHTALQSVLHARVSPPESAVGPAYLSIGARYHQTAAFWVWDTAVVAQTMALLDPVVLRTQLELWFKGRPDQHCTINYLTGQTYGSWYAPNFMSLLESARAYLNTTGDWEWLDAMVGSQTVLEHLIDYATFWRGLDRRGSGLADYSESALLEVVSTYTGEVAAINIGSAFGLRWVAELLARRGDSDGAAALRAEGDALARRVIDCLYVPGGGYWRCALPDGTFNQVRHCYDVITAFDHLFADLSDAQRQEMNDFFWRELHTPRWMRALSSHDVDTTWNIRADHSWCGSYPAWPPKMARGLFKVERPARVAAWMRGLARTANQGVFGQAHLDDTIFPLENDGARKCPPEVPYENEVFALSGGAFIDLIIDTVFGVRFTDGGPQVVDSRLAEFDPHARLEGLRHRDTLYTITLGGVSPLPDGGQA